MKLSLCPRVWMDGKVVDAQDATVPVTTHALHYGTTAFEGIRAYWNGKNLYVFRLADHLRRLRRSGQFYNMILPYTDSQITGGILQLCSENDLQESAYIRPLYFVGEWGISLYVRQKAPIRFAMLAFPMERFFDQGGISACVVSWRRFNDQSTPVQAKMGGNYLNSIAATIEAQRNGFDEAIMLDMAGNLSEGPGANIFLVQDAQLVTPDKASSALSGITKDTVIRLAAEEGITTVERRVSPSELYTSDEVFMTGTALEVTPLVRIGSQDIGTGPVTQQLRQMYSDIVSGRRPSPDGWLTPVY